ncbi:co-chaperone GroES [Candidatus Uhrbacteria bacterium RIFCSPHIGHO2_12_FULL_57_11]|uniref:Co-chaperonin GroES n=1 Tax=Candidatus Uhrbacteria bacterium RIFCSPHIGHO2_12_FULL_57_11 TaxID=1802398 RepID=A0A1F7UL85_9BACT|nr:MAG: co-chaperone GroES [Candidatus Uhrbacteria bacterium RIFCSPHIGHO2_12_FULL_57_11]
MKLRPLGDRVIVKPIQDKEATASGIILPDTAKEKPEQGEVMAVGPGKLLENGSRAPVSVKVGDKVVFKKYSPDEVKIDGVEYFVLREEDLMAVVE